MRTYRPKRAPDNPAQLPGFLRQELVAIQQAAFRAEPFLEVEYLTAEPERVRAGMLVGADGANWDPGSGEGVYRRNAANNAWVFIG